MQLPVRGHPLHTRSLTLFVALREDGRWHARGDVIDLRKVGFVPIVADIQPAGIIHQMSIDLVVDPDSQRIESVEVDQPFVAVEASEASGGDCCRDPAPRLKALEGELLDGAFAKQLSGVFGGPRGCSHLLTLFQVVASGLRRALALEASLGDEASARVAGDRLFRRALFVEGFEAEDESIQMGVQLADFHTRPVAPDAPPTARLASQTDVRFFARVAGPERLLSDLRVAERERGHETLGTAQWRDGSERLASLAGMPAIPGLAGRLFALYPEPEERVLLDACLQLAPGYIQVMAAVMDRWLAQMAESQQDTPISGSEIVMAEVGNVGGMPDSCYIWRSGGSMASRRQAAEGGAGD